MHSEKSEGNHVPEMRKGASGERGQQPQCPQGSGESEKRGQW